MKIAFDALFVPEIQKNFGYLIPGIFQIPRGQGRLSVITRGKTMNQQPKYPTAICQWPKEDRNK